jgi:bifunctional non-homologous end joining protein LigD
VLFDLDPEPPAGLDEAVQVAYLLYNELINRGIRCYVKSSGNKGLHVVIPVRPIYSFEETKEFVHKVGSKLAQESDLIVSERSQTAVPGTVLIDYPQNTERATMVAPYVLRPTREATVSTPLDWSELTKLHPFDWNIFNVPERDNKPWADLLSKPETLVL